MLILIILLASIMLYGIVSHLNDSNLKSHEQKIIELEKENEFHLSTIARLSKRFDEQAEFIKDAISIAPNITQLIIEQRKTNEKTTINNSIKPVTTKRKSRSSTTEV